MSPMDRYKIFDQSKEWREDRYEYLQAEIQFAISFITREIKRIRAKITIDGEKKLLKKYDLPTFYWDIENYLNAANYYLKSARLAELASIESPRGRLKINGNEENYEQILKVFHSGGELVRKINKQDFIAALWRHFGSGFRLELFVYIPLILQHTALSLTQFRPRGLQRFLSSMGPAYRLIDIHPEYQTTMRSAEVVGRGIHKLFLPLFKRLEDRAHAYVGKNPEEKDSGGERVSPLLILVASESSYRYVNAIFQRSGVGKLRRCLLRMARNVPNEKTERFSQRWYVSPTDVVRVLNMSALCLPRWFSNMLRFSPIIIHPYMWSISESSQG